MHRPSLMRSAAAALAVLLPLAGAGALAPPPASAATAPCKAVNRTTGRAFASLTRAIAVAAPGQVLTVTGTCVGSFVIRKPLALRRGAEPAVLAGDGGRVLVVRNDPSGAPVRLKGLKITGGVALDCPGREVEVCGGGILVLGRLSLANVNVAGNRADGTTGDASGAGVHVVQGAILVVSRSTFRGNETTAPTRAGAWGAAIGADGELTVATSRFLANRAVGVQGASGGAIALTDGSATITGSTFSGNEAYASGVNGGAEGGALYVADSPLTVATSTFDGNAVRGQLYAAGGAIAAVGSRRVTLRTSTVTGNVAALIAGRTDGSASGGGVFLATGRPATLAALTIAGNSVTNDAAAAEQVAGGGLGSATNGPTIEATIIAGNAAPDAPDCSLSDSGTSRGHNLLGDAAGCAGTIVDGVAGDQAGTAAVPLDPGLGALAANGGPTMTLALQSGSPAVDTGGAAPCASAIDQRGVARPQGGRCDIGAVEQQP